MQYRQTGIGAPFWFHLASILELRGSFARKKQFENCFTKEVKQIHEGSCGPEEDRPLETTKNPAIQAWTSALDPDSRTSGLLVGWGITAATVHALALKRGGGYSWAPDLGALVGNSSPSMGLNRALVLFPKGQGIGLGTGQGRHRT